MNDSTASLFRALFIAALLGIAIGVVATALPSCSELSARSAAAEKALGY